LTVTYRGGRPDAVAPYAAVTRAWRDPEGRLLLATRYDGFLRLAIDDETAPPLNPAPRNRGPQALIVAVPLYYGAPGPEGARLAVAVLEHDLESAILEAGVGEFEGHKCALESCALYLCGPDAERLAEVAATVIAGLPSRRGVTGIKRYGPLDDLGARTETVRF
jgi:hypothetical protein